MPFVKMHIMRASLIILLLGFSIVLKGNTYYVSTTGSDLHSGTFSQPWGTWQKAFNTAKAGDTVYFRGGTWYPTDYYVGNSVTRIAAKQIDGVYSGPIYGHDGTRENPICFFAYPPDYEAGNHPILDCSRLNTEGHVYNNGIEIYATDWLYFKGLTVKNIYQPTTPDPSWNNWHQLASGIGTYVCSNLTFENMTVNDIGGRGFSVSGTVGYFGIESDTTRWINCDVYNCIDSLSSVPGNGADGWKVNGDYNYPVNNGGLWEFIGCRAWNCSDDGFDPSGSFQVIFDHCWAFYNGHYGTVLDGNGFKSGGVSGEDILAYPSRIIKNCLSAYNVGIGIYDLEYPDYRRNNSRIYNNTVYKNGIGIQISSNVNYPNSLSVYKNNIIYETVDRDAVGRPYNLSVACYYTESHNTWDYSEEGSLPNWTTTDTVTVTDADFISIDSTGIRGSRKADGSLPDIDFLKLAPTSDLIDAGTAAIPDIDNITFYGSAPDIGYSEYLTGSVTLPVPNFVTAIVENSTPTRVDITFSLTLANIVPPASAFTVTVNSSTRNVTSVTISGNKVLLTLASPVIFGDIVTVAYAKPSTNPLQTAAGGQAASITAKTVTNNIAPVIPIFVSAVIENATPGRLDITYSITLSNIAPAASVFTVMVNSATRGVSSVTISGNKVLLTMTSQIKFGDIVTVAYTKPSANPLQTVAGGQAVTTTAQQVINNCSLIPNQPPVICITSPTKSNSYVSPASITIEATASDPDGTVNKVEFFNGSVKIGERTSAPYFFTWKEVAEGTYLLTAVATDNSNSKTVSAPISTTVLKSVTVPNQLPIVTITSPYSNRKVKKNDKVVIEVAAVDPDGIISKVILKNGNTTIAEWTTPPYLFTWEGVDEGIYQITATATDNSGATSVSQIVELTVDPLYDAGSEILNLYPNPNEGRFSIDLIPGSQGEKPTITIVSLTGKTIYNEILTEGEGINEFDLSDASPGIYILLVTNGSSITATKKFIKK